jgi:phosphoribosylformimino-5-aminoimidazole carboxamide ribotide isomerase
MMLYPALDLRGGHVVRLRQGDYAQEQRYGNDALALARAYVEQGARWLHVVDLDGARAGQATALATIERLARDSGARVQAGGGVRVREDVQALLDAGVARIVVGSVAVREPATVCDWLGEFGVEQLCIALDTRRDKQGRWTLPVHGWTEASGASWEHVLEHYAALAPQAHVLCTDIARDGMMSGPSVDLYRDVRARFPSLRVQASGGIRGARDLAALRELGMQGAIVGRALLEGAAHLPELMT